MACGGTVVDTDVEPLGGKLPDEGSADIGDQGPDVLLTSAWRSKRLSVCCRGTTSVWGRFDRYRMFLLDTEAKMRGKPQTRPRQAVRRLVAQELV